MHTFADSIKNHMLENIDKVIDEGRQGEAFPENAPGGISGQRKLFLESYGCQMNFADSEVVASILKNEGFVTTKNIDEADVILVNTCAIRDNAEQRVRNRLTEFNRVKKNNPDTVIGVLGSKKKSLLILLLVQMPIEIFLFCFARPKMVKRRSMYYFRKKRLMQT